MKHKKAKKKSTQQRRRDYLKRLTQEYFNEHEDTPADNRMPDARWMEYSRLATLPFGERYPLDKNGLLAVEFITNVFCNVRQNWAKQEARYNLLETAAEIYHDDSPMSIKWKLEAMLCMQLPQHFISIELNTDLQVIAFYEFYFFDVRSLLPEEILTFIEYHCGEERYDGPMKWVGAKFGYYLYKAFNLGVHCIAPEERDRVLSCIQSMILDKMLQTVSIPRNNIRESINIFIVQMKKQLTELRAQELHSRSGFKDNSQMSLEEAWNEEMINNLIPRLTELENQKAIEKGGRVAKDLVKSQKQSHLEAALEVMTLPRDHITQEEIDELGFQRDP